MESTAATAKIPHTAFEASGSEIFGEVRASTGKP